MLLARVFDEPRRWLSRVPNYLRAFGPWHGLRLLRSIELAPLRGDAPVAHHVPGYGAVWLRPTLGDHSVFWQCLVLRQYHTGTIPHVARLMDAYRAMLAAGRTPLILDCGANIGMSVLWLANAFPQAVIVAVEPEAANFALMQRNTAQLGARVLPVRCAVAAQPGTMTLTNPDDGSTAFQFAPAAAGEVACRTVDDLCAMVPDSDLFIAKVDIEGGQKYLFAENTAWLGRAHAVLIELEDWLLPWQGTSRAFFRATCQFPYEFLTRGETLFCFRDDQAA